MMVHSPSAAQPRDGLPMPEQTAVFVDLVAKDGIVVRVTMTVDHVNGEILYVHLPENFRCFAEPIGVDPYATCFEGYLETLARVAFQKMGGH